MGRVIHFEFATPDPEREIEFFRSAFGWKIEGWGEEEYWLIDAGENEPGINGAIMPMRTVEEQRVVATIGVEDIDDTVATATAAGAKIAMDKQEVPGVGWTASLISPTGMVFAIMQPIEMPGD